MQHRKAARLRLLTAIRDFQARTGASPASRWLADQLGYTQTGISYALRAAERDGDLRIDRSSYRHTYLLKECPCSQLAADGQADGSNGFIRTARWT